MSVATGRIGIMSNRAKRPADRHVDSSSVRVRDLVVGDVVSVPDVNRLPAAIEAISDLGDVRFLFLIDLETTEPMDTRLALNNNRLVLRHDVPIARHLCTNESPETVTITLGDHSVAISRGLSFEYVGPAKPDNFPAPDWSHLESALEVRSTRGDL